jgi:hypothetical protein
MNDNAAVIEEIAQALNEPKPDAIKAAVDVIRPDRAKVFLHQALEVEANGGLLTTDQSRRRTPGGVFFQLVRKGVSKEERKLIFPYRPKRKKKKSAGPAAKPTTPALTWDEAKQLIAKALKSTGEAQTVKVTLIGRPLKVVQQKECVVVSLKGKELKALPKGLPPVPEGSAITWAVLIVTKQWSKVKARIEQNQDDALIIEGYPIVGKGGVAAVMTTNCKSVLMERAQREQKQAAS